MDGVEIMDIRYTQGDLQIGDIVTMVLDKDMRGMVTGIQLRDNSFVYIVSYVVNGTAVEWFQRPIEIRKAK